jgi:hypothetical protein
MIAKARAGQPLSAETSWTFEAGDRVPEWLFRQTNCVLWFERGAVVVASADGFQLYPESPMGSHDTLVLAEIIDHRIDSEVEHVLPITTHITPRKFLLN